jgi:hypothetical protein
MSPRDFRQSLVLGLVVGLTWVALSGQTQADDSMIPFTIFQDNIGSFGEAEKRIVFTSAAGYRAHFGHDAPGVNFATEWVVFYSAGRQRSSGYKASIKRISRSNSGETLKVTTSLESPGPDCPVRPVLTAPYSLVKLPAPNPRSFYYQFYKEDMVQQCSSIPTLRFSPNLSTGPSPCANVRCVAGTHCEVVGGDPPSAACVPDRAR